MSSSATPWASSPASSSTCGTPTAAGFGPEDIISPELARHLTEFSRVDQPPGGRAAQPQGRGGVRRGGQRPPARAPRHRPGARRPGSPAGPAAGAHPPQVRAARPRTTSPTSRCCGSTWWRPSASRTTGAPGCSTTPTCCRRTAEGALWRTETAARRVRPARLHRRPWRPWKTSWPPARSRCGRWLAGSARCWWPCASTAAGPTPRRRSAELAELARTAGVEVVDTLLQVRRQADPKYLIGKGKLDELNLRAMQRLAEVLVFDKELSAASGAPHRRWPPA